MSYESYNIKRLMSAYGNGADVTTNNVTHNTRAFVKPLKLRHRIYMSDEDKKLMETLKKASQNGYLLYIGPDDVPINETSIVVYKDNTYHVVSSEKARISKKNNYVWAVLEPVQNK